MFYRVAPIPITDPAMISSNLDEDDYPEWDAGDAYAGPASPGALGDRVIRLTTHRIYEATGAVGPTATPPENDPEHWLDVSATNKWQPFDYELASQAIGANISYTLNPSGVPDMLLLFNTSCDSVDVLVDLDGETLMDESYSMQKLDVVDFYSWVMAVPEPVKNRAIPLIHVPGATVTLTFNGTAVAVGQIVMGRAEDWGIGATYNTSFTHRDYSRIAPDDFGKRALVKRPSAFDFSFHVIIRPDRVETIMSRVQDARGTIAAYLTKDALFGSMVLGVMSKMGLDYSSRVQSSYKLDIEGLT